MKPNRFDLKIEVGIIVIRSRRWPRRMLLASALLAPLWIASPLHADVLLWNTSTSTPSPLALTGGSAINNSGMVVGYVGTNPPVAAEVSISAPNVVILLSGIPSSAESSTGLDVNSLGQVAGTYQDSSGYSQAFVWSSGTGMQLLGNLGGNYAIAFAINDASQIVGQTSNAANDLQAFFWSAGTGMVAVGDAATSLATDINDSGQISCEEGISPLGQAALCGPSPTSVTLLNLAALDPVASSALAVNDLGWIVGDTDTSSGTQGFLWTPGGLTIFATGFLPTGLNDAGEVTGSYNGLPAVWTNAGGYQVLPLGTFGGEQIRLTGINDSGQIVGFFPPSGVPEPGTFWTTLSALLVPFSLWARSRRRNRQSRVQL